MNTSHEASAGIPAVKWQPVSSGSSTSLLSSMSHASIVAGLISYTEEYWPQVFVEDASRASQKNHSVLNELLDQVRDATGIATHELGLSMLMDRIGARMRINDIDDLASYKKFLEENPTELPALRKCLFIRVTDFFRDPGLFIQLESALIPSLFENAKKRGLRVLVQGCNTGEEAYSLAFLFDAYNKKMGWKTAFRILANDPDKNALIKARRGFYPHLITADLSALCLDQYFEATKEGYCVIDRVKNMVRFMPGQDDDPAAFADLNLLVCRNPLIFPDSDTEDHLLSTFFNRLQPDGFLIIDPSIQSFQISKYFNVLDPRYGIYQRKKTVGRPATVESKNQPDKANQNDLKKHLKEELFLTKVRLKMAVNEYETTHDDLVDVNHRLQSSMREVVLEKEQLQAEHDVFLEMKDSIINANKGFKKQNDILRAWAKRSESIIAQTGIDLLYLNKELKIEMFTPGLASLLGISRSDKSQPIASISLPFQWDLANNAATVLHTQTGIEHEISTQDRRYYRVILNPSFSDNTLHGVICTFIDNTEQQQKREWERYKANVLEHMTDAVLVTNSDLQITYMNKAAVERYGPHEKKPGGMELNELYRSVWKTAEEKKAAHRALSEKGCWSGEYMHLLPDGRQSRVISSIQLLNDDSGHESGILTVVRNIDSERGSREESTMRALITDLERRSESLRT